MSERPNTEPSESPKRSQADKDYDTAEGYVRLAVSQAHKRGNGLSLGADVFDVTEQLLIAIYYLIRSKRVKA